jgi:hypothetical protein
LEGQAGLLLISGLIAFAIGGLLPPVRAFTGSPEEQMATIRVHPRRWAWSAIAIGVSVVLTLGGSVLLGTILRDDGAGTLSILGPVFFGFAGVFFVIELAFRATVQVDASTADQVPAGFDVVRRWAGSLYWVYMPLSYVALAAFGGAILQASTVDLAFGWVAAVVGLGGALVYVVRAPGWLWTIADLPGVLYLVTGAIGVDLLLR